MDNDDYNVHIYSPCLLPKTICLKVLHGLQTIQHLSVFFLCASLSENNIQRHGNAFQQLIVRVRLPGLKQFQLVLISLSVQKAQQKRIAFLWFLYLFKPVLLFRIRVLCPIHLAYKLLIISDPEFFLSVQSLIDHYRSLCAGILCDARHLIQSALEMAVILSCLYFSHTQTFFPIFPEIRPIFTAPLDPDSSLSAFCIPTPEEAYTARTQWE